MANHKHLTPEQVRANRREASKRQRESHRGVYTDRSFTHVGRDPIVHHETKALPSGPHRSPNSSPLTGIDDVDDLLREWGVDK